MGIFSRVSVREFSKKPVDGALVTELLRAAMQAPSARNQQPWEFLVITDKAHLEALSTVAPNFRSLKTAPMAIALYYHKEGLTSPTYVLQDMAACTENILLQADDMGLGAVWMGVAPNEERMALIEERFMPIEGCAPFCLIAVGHPAEKKPQQDRFDQSRIRYLTK